MSFCQGDRFVLNTAAIGDSNVDEAFDILAELKHRHDFEVLIAIWPLFSDRATYYPKHLFAVYESKLLLVEKLAKKYEFSTFRMDGIFKEDLKKRIADLPKRKKPYSPNWIYTVGDGTHPSKLGSLVAAKGLKDFILNEQLVAEYQASSK